MELLWAPLLGCLVLTGIHVYLGLHVLARGVIFADLALAQVAALGVTVAFLFGYPMQSDGAYWYALAFTVGGAAVFSVSRAHRAPIPQEAIIGIVYAVSAAATVLVIDRVPQGGEHIKQMLVGSILNVSGRDVASLAILYALVGAGHFLARRPFLEISLDPDRARASGRRIAWWDFAFYVSFGLVVTSSVRLAGVLLVFSYLIVPAAVATLLVRSVGSRLLLGWALGAAVSALGIWLSYAWDLPTGATVVTTFGALIAAVAAGAGGVWLVRETRQRGRVALRSVGLASFAIIGLAGLLLVLLPGMDHLWLDAVEEAAPAVQLAFLTPGERRAYQDSHDGLRRGAAEIDRARAIQQDAQWGRRPISEEQQERLRQFLAGRREISAGDRMVLRTLRGKARERQRFLLGLPLLAVGAGGAYWLTRRRD